MSSPSRPRTSGEVYAQALAKLPGLKAVGAQTYSPRYDAVKKTPPRVSFGTGRRFVSTKVAFISKEHNQDMLCSLSPGPIYDLGSPRTKVGPRWPSREEVLQRKKGSPQSVEETTHLGPGSYSPHEQAVRANAPRPAIPRAERFAPHHKLPFISDAHNLTLGGEGRPGPAYEYSEALTVRHPPAWSFGPRLGTAPASSRKRLGSPARRTRSDASTSDEGEEGEDAGEGEEEKGQVTLPPPRPRDSFWTQDIKGCMSKPATLECDIGPGHYDVPDPETLARLHRQGWSFSKAGRFARPGSEFISTQHTASLAGTESPGPKYTPQDRGMGKTSRNRTKGYIWVP